MTMTMTQPNLGVTRHGYAIIAASDTPRDHATCAGRVILADRGRGHAHRFVTWWVNLDLGGYCCGHYIDDEAEAYADFANRVKKGF